MKMTPERIREARERGKRAMTGPLQVNPNNVCYGMDGKTRIAVTDPTPSLNICGHLLSDDAACYVASRTDLPDALGDLEEARGLLAELWGTTCPDCGPDDYKELVEHIKQRWHKRESGEGR